MIHTKVETLLAQGILLVTWKVPARVNYYYSILLYRHDCFSGK